VQQIKPLQEPLLEKTNRNSVKFLFIECINLFITREMMKTKRGPNEDSQVDFLTLQ
jgi:hypothetical protein